MQFALGVKPVAIDRLKNGFRLRMADRAVTASRLFSTIPIERVQALCAMERRHVLDTTTLISLYFSFSGERGFPQPIVYNFSHEGAWKRLTVYSDFYGLANGREYFAVEVVAEQPDQSTQTAASDFRAHVSANGLFRGDLKLEGSQVLSNAYPVYSRGAARHADKAIAELNAFGIQSYGRHGGFNYQPTARVSTLDAEAALGFERKASQPPQAVEVSPQNEQVPSPLLISSPTTP
uniref:hypothetical protein n=1 Tax=Neorhizobium sp. EC2-8 TaxID=3129230 RepID=UPI0031015C47